MQKQIELALKVQQDIDALHRAVNQIHELRANLRNLEKWAGESSSSSEVVSAARALDQKMTPVEGLLMQVKMKSSEGNLGYPNMLNEQYATFNEVVQYVDAAPTAQELLVFDELHSRLSAQLASWQEIVRGDVPALNDLMRKHGVPTLAVGAGQGE
jgi:hypothetical protein